MGFNKNLLSNIFRRTAPFRWLSQMCCCKKKDLPKSQFANGRSRGVPRNLNQNYDSMRTFTTSLTVTSRHSTCIRPNRVVIMEHQKSFLPTQEEVNICQYVMHTALIVTL